VTGVITRLVLDRGFGFIASDEGGPNIFFHVNALRNLAWDEQLTEMPVEFDVVRDDQGRSQGRNVTRRW
jgi:cold shock CspA family protein